MGGCCSCYQNDEPPQCDKHSVHVPDKPDQADDNVRQRSISLSLCREENTPGPEIEVDLEIPAIPYQVEHVRRMSSDDEADHICDVTRNEVIEYLDENMAVNTRSSLDVASIQTVTHQDHDDVKMAAWGSISINDDHHTNCENRSDSTSLKNGSGYNIDCSISCSSNSTIGYY